jgi:hypothetical protein
MNHFHCRALTKCTGLNSSVNFVSTIDFMSAILVFDALVSVYVGHSGNTSRKIPRREFKSKHTCYTNFGPSKSAEI